MLQITVILLLFPAYLKYICTKHNVPTLSCPHSPVINGPLTFLDIKQNFCKSPGHALLTTVKPFVLTDPTFHMPGPVDVLIRTSLYPEIIKSKANSLGPHMPYVLNSIFGHVIIEHALLLTLPLYLPRFCLCFCPLQKCTYTPCYNGFRLKKSSPYSIKKVQKNSAILDSTVDTSFDFLLNIIILN